LIRLAGKVPGVDIPIVYTGLRSGEKLHETLFYMDENCRPTTHAKVLEAGPREFSGDQVLGNVAELRRAVAAYDLAALHLLLRTTVSEYRPLDSPVVHSTSAKIVAFPIKEAGRKN